MSVKLKTGASARVPVGSPQAPSYLHKYFKFSMIDQSTPSTGVPAGLMGVLPAYAVPLRTLVRINTAFSGGNLKIGTTADLSTLASTADVASATTGLYVVDRYMGTFSTADVTLYCATDTSGATAGDADIWLEYIAVPFPTTY